MSAEDRAERDPGAVTAVDGTAVPVDVGPDRRGRGLWVVLLAGPVIWFAHFMVVYLVAEAGCTGDGTGLDAFDPPVPRTVTLVATALAVLACAAAARHSWRSWQWGRSQWPATGAGDRPTAEAHRVGGGVEDVADGVEDVAVGVEGEQARRDPGGQLAYAGLLLALFSAVAVLFVGLPAPFLPAC